MSTKDLDILRQRLTEELPVQAQILGLDLAALIKDRVVQTGISADGSSFTPYSDKKVAAFRYFGKSRSGGGERGVQAASKRGDLLSYSDFRELNNLNTRFKNFEFTGEMWRGVEVTTQKNGITTFIIIGGGSPDVKRKLQANTDLEKKSILAPSEAEIALVSVSLNEWFSNLVNKTLV